MHDAESESECEFRGLALSCADRIAHRFVESLWADPLRPERAADNRSCIESPISSESASLEISLRRKIANELRDLAIPSGSKGRRVQEIGASDGRRRIRDAATQIHRTLDCLVKHRDRGCPIRSVEIDLQAITSSASSDRSHAKSRAWVLVARSYTDLTTVGIISSHVADHDRANDDRLGRLRQAIRATDGHRLAWLTEGSTSIGCAVRHICHRTNRTSIELSLASAKSPISDWLSSLAVATGRSCLHVTTWQVSPLLLSTDHVSATPQSQRGYADLLIASLADRLIVLNTRRNSVTERITNALRPSVPTRFAPISRVEQVRATRFSHATRAGRAPSTILRPTNVERSSPMRPPFDKLNSFAFHWTRSRIGAWPDQSTTDYLDEIIWSATLTDRSSLGVLARIVTHRMLYASGKLIRGGTPCVCFSAATLDDILRKKTFRPHLRRWDFEPFGIGVRKSTLVEIGGREVTYGDEATWRQLGQLDRPFFQKQRTKSAKRRPIDWSVEKECRLIGNLDLERLKPIDVIVIVPTASHVESLQSISPWHVYACESLVPGFVDGAKTTRPID